MDVLGISHVLSEAIPRNFAAMFRFNAAVMGVAKQDWMYEARNGLRWSGDQGRDLPEVSGELATFTFIV